MRRLGFLLAMAVLASLLPTAGLESLLGQRRRASKLKLGTVAPKNSVFHEMLLKMRQEWREITNGAVDLAIYPGGVAGDEVTMLRKMRNGQMQAALLSGSGMGFLDEGVSALQVPLMFESLEEFDYVLDKMAPTLEKRLRDKGFTALGWGDAGWARFFAVKEFRTPAELREMKLYTSKGDDDMLRLFGEFGFLAVPLDLTELQANLETGLVDVFAVPPLIAAGYQWFGSAPNMLDMRFVAILGSLLINNDVWDAIPADQQQRMREVATDLTAEIEKAARTQEASAIRSMQEYGLRVIELDQSTLAEWRREMEAVYPGLRDRYAPGELLDAAVRWRDEYRAKRSDPKASQ